MEECLYFTVKKADGNIIMLFRSQPCNVNKMKDTDVQKKENIVKWFSLGSKKIRNIFLFFIVLCIFQNFVMSI